MSPSIRAVALPPLAALLALGLVAPAAAQFSAGYKFLESVRKKEASEVEDTLSKSGTNIVNTRDVTSGQTALHIVTERRDRTWMAFLLQHGANPNARDARGVAPLQLAANLGFIEGVELLVQYRADVEQANDAGETPLISAVHRHDLPMARLLLRGGADPDRPDSSGRSARDYATAGGQEGMVTLLATQAKAKGKAPGAAAAGPVYGPKL